MTETLFGGILLAAILFFVIRRAGLPNFWAAVISGLVPFVAYLFYSNQHWAGGDVLAIHFAVYLANAGLLGVFGGMQQKKEKMHWAPRVIIAFFIGLVMLNAVLLSIASRGLPDKIAAFILPNPDQQRVHTAFPGVVPHDRNKSYQPHLERVEQQRNLGWEPKMQGVETLQSGKPGKLLLTIKDGQGQAVEGAQVDLGFWRLANSRDDKRLVMKETAAGIYESEVNLPDPGRWIMELYISKGENDFVRQQQLFLEE
jgi:nitrogen fixation protein FixH